MARWYFDVWDKLDYMGAALGELTDAVDKQLRVADQSPGAGSFEINRHSSQAAWVGTHNLVRARLVDGGPFDADDPRYVGAFFIEDSADVVVSEDEEGGEQLKRGGPTIETYLHRAIIYSSAGISGHASFWRNTLETGEVEIYDRTIGEALRILILNAQDRAGVLEDLTLDFTISNDSDGTPWPDAEDVWKFPVGMDLLTVLSKVVSSQTWYRMTPGFLLSCYENRPGDDLTATVVFEKGVNISEAAEKTISGQGMMTRALVRGTKKNNNLLFRQYADTSREATDGRFEGYVEYTSTATEARLLRAGAQAVARAKLQSDGPTSAGVLATVYVPFDDYVPGDVVSLDVGDGPVDARVKAIALKDTEAGEYDVIIEFDDSPFDPASGPDTFGNAAPTNTGGGAPRGCGDCPPVAPGPFIPPADCSALIDEVLTIQSGGGNPINASPDKEFAFTASPVALVVGRQYRIVVEITGNLNPPSYGADHVFAFGAHVHEGITATKFEGSGPTPDAVWDGGGGTDTSLLNYDFGISWNVKNPIRDGGTAPNGSYDVGETIEGEWVEYVGPNTDTEVYGVLTGSALSGYYGFAVTARFRLEQREGDASAIDCPGDDQETPLTGQPVGELSSQTGTSRTVNWAYKPGSLKVFVGGVLVQVTETDPTTGAYELPFDPGTAQVVTWYQAAGGNDTATGATNAYLPQPGVESTIPSELLPATADDKWKQPARVATTASITISTALNVGDTIDGVTLAEGDRVLVKDQSTGSQNGVYVAGASPARATDFDESDEVVGALVYVVAGTTNGGRLYRATNTTAPTIDSTTITFAEFASGASGAAGGDLSGTYPNPSVVDDSHSHTASTVAIPFDDLTDVVITSPATSETVIYDGTQWVNTSAIWRPLMDGAGAVITDGGTGEAIMALS